MSSRDFGLGPKWWQQPGNKLKKCSERFSEWCDPTETDGCCAVIPCMYCLELDVYGQGETQYGTTDFSTMGWSGSVGGGTFFGFWEVGQYSGKCEFVVHWNGEEVYRQSCDEGQSCRDSSDEAAVVINYEDAVLRWVKHEYRPMPYVKDPDTECTIHFCGECECTCECLCLLLVEPDGTQYREEFCDSAYDVCFAPVWEGTIGYRSVRLTLARDSYTGQCVILVRVDGEDFEPIPVTNCTALSGSIVLPDYSELSFTCKKCGCNGQQEIYPCECANDDDLNGYGSFGVLESGGTCDLEFTSSSGNGTTGRPTANIAWIEAEDDCVITLAYLHKLTAFPPDCTSIDSDVLSKRLVFVKKGGSGVTPNIDNDVVQENDWYVVVYAATTDTLLGVFYEYDICCYNETPLNAATSHFIWVKFPGVILGDASYTVGMYAQQNANEYGNCGFEKPGPTPP